MKSERERPRHTFRFWFLEVVRAVLFPLGIVFDWAKEEIESKPEKDVL